MLTLRWVFTTSDLDCGLFLHEFLVLFGYLGSLMCYKLHSRCVFDGDNMIIYLRWVMFLMEHNETQ